MTPEKVKERTKFLIEFLDLPNRWALISNLSGGQQRSVTYFYIFIGFYIIKL